MNNLQDAKIAFAAKKAQMNQRIELLKRTIKAEAEEMLKSGCRFLFENNPKLKSFAWTQFTCYWNDGEECYFSAHIDPYCLEINGTSAEEESEEVHELRQQINKYEQMELIGDEIVVNDKPLGKLIADKKAKLAEELAAQKEMCDLTKVIADLLNTFTSDDLLTMFGDHRKVIVTSEEIKIESYRDHH